MAHDTATLVTKQARQAFLVWLAFIAVNILVHGTIPFAFGHDVRAWVESESRFILWSLLVYGFLFLVIPLILVKGWPAVRRPDFMLPLLLAVVAAALWHTFRWVGLVIVLVLAFLHWRFDLSELGMSPFRSPLDLLAVLAIAMLYTVPRLLRPIGGSIDLFNGVEAGLFRLFGNPATSAENLFYFGFLGTRLARRTGRALTPILLGLMYMVHEMTNPEYWYEGMQFGLVFVGVAFASAVYFWRRSIVPIWLGDGLSRFIQGLVPSA